MKNVIYPHDPVDISNLTFFHPQNTKENILKNVSNQNPLAPIDVH